MRANGYVTGQALYFLGRLEMEQGNLARAAERLENSLALGREQRNNLLIPYALRYLALLAARQQDLQRAKTLLEEALSLLRAANMSPGIVMMLVELGKLALNQGDYPRARECLTENVQISHAIGSAGNTGECLAAFAALAAARGQYARAARLLAASTTLLEPGRFESTDLERRAQEQWLADIHRELEEGDFARATAEGRAMTLEQAIAYVLETPATSEPLAEPRTTRQAAKEEFGGLTAREREIAARIAQGESNRGIAEELVVSERTVETHVGNIFNKLGFTSRAQIRKWAIEKGLVKRDE